MAVPDRPPRSCQKGFDGVVGHVDASTPHSLRPRQSFVTLEQLQPSATCELDHKAKNAIEQGRRSSWR
jgi:hypothetical protein